jgi:hypothetical protein
MRGAGLTGAPFSLGFTGAAFSEEPHGSFRLLRGAVIA